MTSTKKTMVVKAGNATAKTTTEVNDALPAVPCPDPAGYRYVGARYVPIFADPIDWNKNTSYEPLTIVVNEGTSYTSKTFVPAGIDIANTDYWALTGNYNAQVEQYRQEVQNAVTKVNESLANALSDIDEVKKDAIKIKSTMTNVHAVVIGDSFSDPNYIGIGNTRPWVTELESSYGWTIENFSNRGSGFVTQATDTGKTFKDLANDAVADNTYDHESIDYVIIYGGYNDFFNNVPNTTNILNGILETLQILSTGFPKSEIKLYIINNGGAGYVTAKVRSAYNGIIMRLCQNNINCKIIPCMHWISGYLRNSGMFETNNYIHPSAESGQKFIAQCIAREGGLPFNSRMSLNEFIDLDSFTNEKFDVSFSQDLSIICNGDGNGLFNYKIGSYETDQYLSITPKQDFSPNTVNTIELPLNKTKGFVPIDIMFQLTGNSFFNIQYIEINRETMTIQFKNLEQWYSNEEKQIYLNVAKTVNIYAGM